MGTLSHASCYLPCASFLFKWEEPSIIRLPSSTKEAEAIQAVFLGGGAWDTADLLFCFKPGCLATGGSPVPHSSHLAWSALHRTSGPSEALHLYHHPWVFGALRHSVSPGGTGLSLYLNLLKYRQTRMVVLSPALAGTPQRLQQQSWGGWYPLSFQGSGTCFTQCDQEPERQTVFGRHCPDLGTGHSLPHVNIHNVYMEMR